MNNLICNSNRRFLGRGWARQNTTVLYPIYYAVVDMFQPLWAIFRSQNV